MQITITSQNNNTQTIHLPEGTQKITRAFFLVNNAIGDVSEISIPDGILTIDNFAFGDYTSLTSISLPPSLTHIGDYAFRNCTRLSSIDLPPSLTHIGSFAFSGCTSLSSIHLPTPLQLLGLFAFKNCTRLTTILTSQALNQDIAEVLAEMLPDNVNVITIETLIPSLADATPEQISVVLSLIDLDTSSFDQPPTLHLSKEALQKMAATLIKTFPSFSVRQLQELLSLNDSTYKPLYETLFKRFKQKSDGSNDYLLPILEHLPLKDLAKFLATSKDPLAGLLTSELAGLLASEKAITMKPNSFFSSKFSPFSQTNRALSAVASFLHSLSTDRSPRP